MRNAPETRDRWRGPAKKKPHKAWRVETMYRWDHEEARPWLGSPYHNEKAARQAFETQRDKPGNNARFGPDGIRLVNNEGKVVETWLKPKGVKDG